MRKKNITRSKVWTLGDGEERNHKHPKTFYIPSATVRYFLQPGQDVKLMFERTKDSGVGGERMWVKVIDRKQNKYIGKLLSIPVCFRQLRQGSLIEFEPKHIIDFWVGDVEATN